MASNKTLKTANKNKNDEFYTQLRDIERELEHYEKQFENKIVYCNCDDPYESNFFKYFAMSFNQLKLKKLIATCYIGSPIANTEMILFDNEPVENKTTRSPHKIIINELSDENNDGGKDLRDIVISLSKNKNNTLTRLKGDGDFRSEECIEFLKEADIVCTNPPFSLFREYVAQLVEYDKKFIIIGNPNAITYKEIFPLIKDNKLRLGYKSLGQDMLFNISKEFKKELIETKKEGSAFKIVDGEVKARSMACWFTNLYVKKYEEDIFLYKYYNTEEYPTYDNYDAINVDKTKEIPRDYEGVMDVPISFLDKWNPKQFEIIGLANDKREIHDAFIQATPFYLDDKHKKFVGLVIDGKATYARILIKPLDLRYDRKKK